MLVPVVDKFYTGVSFIASQIFPIADNRYFHSLIFIDKFEQALFSTHNSQLKYFSELHLGELNNLLYPQLLKPYSKQAISQRLKRIMKAEVNGRRSWGQQKKRWGDMIHQDMKSFRLIYVFYTKI